MFEDCQKVSFQAYYKAYDVANFADEFYNNKNGMLDSFEEMWTKVAQYFTLETNIIAYDVLHQPSNPADWNSKATYRSFGRNNKVLWPFYRRIGKRIRQIDNSKLFFFEPDDLDFIHFYELPSE